MNCVHILIIASLVWGIDSIPPRHRRQFDWADSSDDDQNSPNGNSWNDDGSTWNRPPIGQTGNDRRPEVTSAPTAAAASGSTTTRAPASFTRCLSNCMTTQEYNPVCGTDGNTYNNSGRLRCAAVCGANVQFARGGTCQPL